MKPYGKERCKQCANYTEPNCIGGTIEKLAVEMRVGDCGIDGKCFISKINHRTISSNHLQYAELI